MKLSKAVLPSCVIVGGETYEIKTDFRYALLFLEKIRGDCPVADLDFMYDGEPPADRQAGFAALAKWINPPRKLPRPAPVASSEILLDYEDDAPLIFAAFWEQYGIDLFDEKLRLHWHKFLALLYGLHGTRLNEVQEYRSYKPRKGDPPEYRREMLRLREMWRIDEKLTASEQAAVDAFQAKLKG